MGWSCRGQPIGERCGGVQDRMLCLRSAAQLNPAFAGPRMSANRTGTPWLSVGSIRHPTRRAPGRSLLPTEA